MERKLFTFIAVLLLIAGAFIFVQESSAQEAAGKLSLSTSENALMSNPKKAGSDKEVKDSSANAKEDAKKEVIDKKANDKAEKKETGKADEKSVRKETPAVTESESKETEKEAPAASEPEQKAAVMEPAIAVKEADVKKAEDTNKTDSPFDFESYIVKSAFREIYTGNDLTASEKELIKLTVFFSTNEDDEKLTKEITKAVDLGIKPEKIIAAFVHCSDYVPYQKVLKAVLISKKVFDERKISFENKMPEIKFE